MVDQRDAFEFVSYFRKSLEYFEKRFEGIVRRHRSTLNFGFVKAESVTIIVACVLLRICNFVCALGITAQWMHCDYVNLIATFPMLLILL